jgi:hypothetical protein
MDIWARAGASKFRRFKAVNMSALHIRCALYVNRNVAAMDYMSRIFLLKISWFFGLRRMAFTSRTHTVPSLTFRALV